MRFTFKCTVERVFCKITAAFTWHVLHQFSDVRRRLKRANLLNATNDFRGSFRNRGSGFLTELMNAAECPCTMSLGRRLSDSPSNRIWFGSRFLFSIVCRFVARLSKKSFMLPNASVKRKSNKSCMNYYHRMSDSSACNKFAFARDFIECANKSKTSFN